jgi:hypothetical protein
MLLGADNMNGLDTARLSVDFEEGVTRTAPIIPRRYTFSHSDNSEDFILTIGPDFAFDTNTTRDKILGEWLLYDGTLRFYVYLNMGGEIRQKMHESNFEPRHETVLALEAIRYGDKRFFEAHPEMDEYPIIVYYLYENPELNYAECWGTFADYDITASRGQVSSNQIMEYRVLLDEKTGDLSGDGLPDRVSVYGDKLSDSDFISNIIIRVEGSQSAFNVDNITEVNGYNPSLFLGDFTKDQIDDILFRMDKMFNSMNSKDKGEYGTVIKTMKDNELTTIFVNDMYNTEYRFLVVYNINYKVSILNVTENKLFTLDISYKGNDYLSQFYNENGELVRPVQGKVLKAEAFFPVISSDNNASYDLLAIHRIIGINESDLLGFLENLLSWNGNRFISIQMLVATPGTTLIPYH